MNINIWEKKAYYKDIEDTRPNSDEDFIFIKTLNIIKNFRNCHFLDLGSGEGWFIDQISKKLDESNNFVGIDVSKTGINGAKNRKIKNAIFIQYDGEKIPFPDNSFDVTTSNFVFEHLDNPLNVFKEMLRITKNNGVIIITCPNFGSPFFRSPCSKDIRIISLLKRLLMELLPSIFFKNNLHWKKVTPISLPDNIHVSDYDTLDEPSLSFFEKYLKANKYKIIELDSFWQKNNYVNNSKKIIDFKKWLFFFAKKLGVNNILRFQYNGPVFYAVIKK